MEKEILRSGTMVSEKIEIIKVNRYTTSIEQAFRIGKIILEGLLSFDEYEHFSKTSYAGEESHSFVLLENGKGVGFATITYNHKGEIIVICK